MLLRIRPGEKYALWLMPGGEVRERLARVLQDLSARWGGPEFAPHVTLLGGIAGPLGEIVRKSRSLADQIRPFTIRLENIDYLDEYFRCLFVRVAAAAPIRVAHRKAKSLFDHRSDSAFMPHLSLLYGDFSRSLKERLVAELGGRMDLGFRVRGLHLYSTHGDPSRWRRMGNFGLKW
jgi:2'-5' RNA ligase